MVSGWCQDGVRMVSGWCQDGVDIVLFHHVFPRTLEQPMSMVLVWCQYLTVWCRDSVRIVSGWC
jgi:hypothetical protein